MRYAKIINSTSGLLERTEKRKTVLIEGTEISKNEYDCLTAGLEIFVCGFDADEVMEKHFPTPEESEVSEE